MSPRPAAILPCLLLVGCGTPSSPAQQQSRSASVTIFAAASLSVVMPKEISAFEAANPGVTASGDYEGTQALLTKLEADGTLADVFVSADSAHMQTAKTRGLMVERRR